jgi:hypothetical protein
VPGDNLQDSRSERTLTKMKFSAAVVTEVVRAISAGATSESVIRRSWLRAVAARVIATRPDLATEFEGLLSFNGDSENYLRGLSIGEIGVCYEALLASVNRDRRKSSGQFFTPDDAAHFMASKINLFPPNGVWLDPCCGVGNLAWHLAAAQEDPDSFISNRLVLLDIDGTALKTAVALLSAEYSAPGNGLAVSNLSERSRRTDFLKTYALPPHDFAIVNPPYARTTKNSEFETADSRDLFAYFMEKVAKTSAGFISVTPAAYLSAPKYQILRNVIDNQQSGGQVFVFDNVPDTLFRGYKFGSTNSSQTNFVRAAVTACAPSLTHWEITPILRWQRTSRATMFQEAGGLLSTRRIGPNGEWAKLSEQAAQIWDRVLEGARPLAELLAANKTAWSLDVGLTPRYYISATFRTLDRSSKVTLYFRSEAARDRAAIVLNSSVPYLWWRALDGGVTLPQRIIRSVPIPPYVKPDAKLVALLRQSESENLVVKLNAGRNNENVKHRQELVNLLNETVIPWPHELGALYTNNMFAPTL